MFRSNFWEYLASHPRKISLCWRCNVYALFQPLLNALLLQSTVWCRSYSAIFKDWFRNSCCALCCLLWFIPWHALLGTHHSYWTLAIVYICWCPRLGGALVALAIAQQALVEAVAASTLMINHRLWSPADAAPRPTAAYSISQSKPKLLFSRNLIFCKWSSG